MLRGHPPGGRGRARDDAGDDPHLGRADALGALHGRPAQRGDRRRAVRGARRRRRGRRRQAERRPDHARRVPRLRLRRARSPGSTPRRCRCSWSRTARTATSRSATRSRARRPSASTTASTTRTSPEPAVPPGRGRAGDRGRDTARRRRHPAEADHPARAEHGGRAPQPQRRRDAALHARAPDPPARRRRGAAGQTRADASSSWSATTTSSCASRWPPRRRRRTAARDVEASSVVTAMTFSCREFAIRVSWPGRRVVPRRPARTSRRSSFEGYTPEDIEFMGGESIINETVGLGGFAQAAAFPLQDYQGGSPDDGRRTPSGCTRSPSPSIRSTGSRRSASAARRSGSTSCRVVETRRAAGHGHGRRGPRRGPDRRRPDARAAGLLRGGRRRLRQAVSGMNDRAARRRRAARAGPARPRGADDHEFGFAIATVDGELDGIGDWQQPFPIQSISKVFALTLVIAHGGQAIWKRVGREPSGDPFNSLVQLEYDQGVPRNPFVNAGALVVDRRAAGAHRRRVRRGLRAGARPGRQPRTSTSTSPWPPTRPRTASATPRSRHLLASFGNLRQRRRPGSRPLLPPVRDLDDLPRSWPWRRGYLGRHGVRPTARGCCRAATPSASTP